jgi:hypothetical protein
MTIFLIKTKNVDGPGTPAVVVTAISTDRAVLTAVTSPYDKKGLSSGSYRRILDEERIQKWTHIQAEFKCSKS